MENTPHNLKIPVFQSFADGQKQIIPGTCISTLNQTFYKNLIGK